MKVTMKSSSTLVALLLIPCVVLGNVSDVVNSVVQLPVRIVRSISESAINTVDAVANVEHSLYDAVTSPFIALGHKTVNLAEQNSVLLWRAVSAVSIAYMAKYGYEKYQKECPLARLERKVKCHKLR